MELFTTSGFDAPEVGNHHVGELADLADAGLRSLQRKDSLFCHNWDYRTDRNSGRSVRYSIIALLGLLRRESAGLATSVSPSAVRAAIEPFRTELGVGDTGLLLWADVRAGSSDAESMLHQLDRRTRLGMLSEAEGMEVAWWTIGAAEAVAAGLPGEQCLAHAIQELASRRSDRSGLFRHLGKGARAGLPNFATEIYSLLALATLAKHDLDDAAADWAIELGDTLVALQLPDGGWPWLYHAERGTVIEPYEIYSVHQDAMAPMALLALMDATGRTAYLDPVLRGLAWCYGHNELGARMIDDERLVVYRSIRCPRKTSRMRLAGNTALGGILGSRARFDIGSTEVNQTCRPYHLGWILEAWSGREDLVADAQGGRR